MPCLDRIMPETMIIIAQHRVVIFFRRTRGADFLLSTFTGAWVSLDIWMETNRDISVLFVFPLAAKYPPRLLQLRRKRIVIFSVIVPSRR